MLKTKVSSTNHIASGNGESIEIKTEHHAPRINIQVTAPQMRTARFKIIGTAPLVIHRFSEKAKKEMLGIMTEGSVGKKGRKRAPMDTEALYNAARYIAPDGWDGFNVSSIRNGLIRACSIPAVGFKMTLAKMGIFVIAEGRDKAEPQYGLVRIYGTPEKTEMPARLPNGSATITVRPMYREWSAFLNIRFDSEMFSFEDIANLLTRMGQQVGIGEGRPSSKNSAGMDWGTFNIEKTENEKSTY
jgi:hypothetical protein